MPEAGSVLAFDFGTKRIGVAIGTQLAGGRAASARPLTTIDAEANDARFAAIGALIADWQPVRLLVGRPLNDDGTPHEMTARCERFANQLRGRFRLPVDEVDERFLDRGRCRPARARLVLAGAQGAGRCRSRADHPAKLVRQP
jgi:putative Holliday junction resolvase